MRARSPNGRPDRSDRGGLLRCRSLPKRGSVFPLDQLADADVPLVAPLGIVVTGFLPLRRLVHRAAVNDQPIAARSFVLPPPLHRATRINASNASADNTISAISHITDPGIPVANTRAPSPLPRAEASNRLAA